MKNFCFVSIFIYSILAFSILTSTSGCNYKKVERSPHQEQQEVEIKFEDTPHNPSHPPKIAEVDSNTIELSNSSKESDLIKVIEKLETDYINKDIWSLAQAGSSDAFQKALTIYNKAVSKLVETAPTSLTTQQLLARYTDMVLQGCDEAMVGCQNFGWLRVDPKINTNLEYIVASLDKSLSGACQPNCESQLETYYKLLGIAFDMNNQIKKPKLEFLFMKRAKSIAANQIRKKSAKPELLNSLGRRFENILTEYSPNPSSSDFAAFVKDFEPWTYSRLDKIDFNYGSEKMFSFAAKYYLYIPGPDRKADVQVNPDLLKAIHSQQTQSDKLGPSFSLQLKKLKEDARSKKIFENLQVDLSQIEKLDFQNEYFYMIDRLYRGHINLDEAGALWQGSQKNQDHLIKVLNNYMKVELIRQIVKTNQYMGDKFANKDDAGNIKKTIPNEEKFQRTILSSESLSKDWSYMIAQMDHVSIFVNQHVRQNSSRNSQLFVDQVKRNAKFLSVYPNMLLLGYFMIDANAPLTFETFWGDKISVDPTSVMNYLLDGAFKNPWFQFAEDMTPLNKYEIIFAYYYALNTGAFDTFSEIKDSKGKPIVDRLSFFINGLNKTLVESQSALENAERKFFDTRNSDGSYPTFLNICEAEKVGSKNYTLTMKLTDLQLYSLFGNQKKGLLASALKFQDFNENNKVFNNRTAEARLTQLRSILNILIDNLETLGLSDKDLNQNKLTLEAEFKKLMNLKAKLYHSAVAQHRQTSQCINHLIFLERERQSQLFQAEAHYLGQVYEAMLASYNLQPSLRAQKVAAFSKSIEMSKDEKIDGDYYTYSKMDLLKRLARFSQKLKPYVSYELPDLVTQDQLRASVDKITFLDHASGKPVKKDHFIRLGMTILNPEGGSSSLLWLQESLNFQSLHDKLMNMVALYKMSFDLNPNGPTKNEISIYEIIDEAIELAKFVNINSSEMEWMPLMNRRERIPRDQLKGILFNDSYSEYFGILDKVHSEIADIKFYLNEAADYYLATTNIGNFLFPLKPALQKQIDANYVNLVLRAETIFQQIDSAIKEKQKNFDQKNFQITYRLDDASPFIYTTSLIDKGNSILIDERKHRDVQARLNDFHMRRTNGFYQSSTIVKKDDNK